MDFKEIKSKHANQDDGFNEIIKNLKEQISIS